MAVPLSVQSELDFVAGDPLIWVSPSAAGNSFANARGDVVLWVNNTGPSDRTLTVTTKRTGDIGPVNDWTMTIPAGTLQKTPAFDPRRFTDPVTGLSECSFDAVTSLQIAAVQQQTVFRQS